MMLLLRLSIQAERDRSVLAQKLADKLEVLQMVMAPQILELALKDIKIETPRGRSKRSYNFEPFIGANCNWKS